LLARVAAGGRTTLAIVSGRTLADLESRFTTVPAHLVGEYGWEHRRRGTAGTREPLPPGVEGAIAVAVGRARGAGLGPHLECKRASVALHTRALGDQAEGAARLATELWGPLARGPELRCSPFDGGLELAAAGRDKGSAVGWLLEQEPQGTLVVHVGDDESDERAFEAVADRGFGIRVGDPSRPTRAAGWLPDEAAVGDFLEAWLEAVPPAGG
jgi:trehalose 6-phosphate phosphatase